MYRPRIVLGAALIALAVPALASTPVAQAEPNPDATRVYAPALPPGLTESEVDFDTRVEDLVSDIRVIQNGDGLTAFVPDRGSATLTVKWKSPLPVKLLALDGATASGLSIKVVAAKLSQDDLLRLSDDLLEASRAGKVPTVSVVTGNEDASGLVVSVPGDTLKARSSESLAQSFEAVVPVPVTVIKGEAPTAASRQNDSDPWFGGGMMEAPGFNPPGDVDPYLFCSTGFSAVTSGGAGRLLSARHCDDGATACSIAWKDGHHDDLTNGGSAVDCHAPEDTLLIDPIGGTDGWVHGGPWNATSANSRYHLKVGGSGSPVYDQNVCTSGANSGEHCGLKILDRTMTSWTCASATCHGWRAHKPEPSTEVASVGGDSGGPVYMNRSDDRVGARGIIYGGDGNNSCGSVRFAVSNCYSTVYIVDIERIISQWSGVGLSIETQP